MPIPRPYLVLLVAATTALTGCNGGTNTSAGSAGLASPASPTATAESPMDTASPAKPSKQDRNWLKKIHQGNLAEIQAGQLAKEKGSAEAVREFGALLVKDHDELDKQVVKTAKQLGVKLPKNSSGEQKRTLAALRDASRSDFDQEFLIAMRDAHEKAVAQTKTEIEKGSSPQVKQLAEQALPQLERHLEEIGKIPGGERPGDSPAPGNS